MSNILNKIILRLNENMVILVVDRTASLSIELEEEEGREMTTKGALHIG